jgi:preprotein translocase subunit SecB
MKLSPLQLAYYRVTKCSVTARPEYESEEDGSDAILDQMRATLDVQHAPEDDSEHTSAWLVGLCLEFRPEANENCPYEFRIELFGIFQCSKELPGGLDAERLVGINGSSIIYGIARELLLGITEKSMWGGLTLPTMSFTDFREMLRDDDPVDDSSSEIK